MIAVIFEVTLAPGQEAAYFDHAAALRALLDSVPGFISVERFRSLNNPDKLLSLSVFEDEAAVARWRNTVEHRQAQDAGRAGIFAGYRLRVTQVLRDYGHDLRDEAPADSQQRHG